jgi:hypothetical protein
MLGVLGVLLTEKGKLIQKEMHSHLYMHTLLDIEQEPPGSLAEYPALYYLLQLSLDTHRPVLYCHTKGAFNQIPPTPNRPHRISMLDVKPENASDTDWQPTVRKMWYHEFGTSRLHDYLNIVDTKQPTVACPYTGRNKVLKDYYKWQLDEGKINHDQYNSLVNLPEEIEVEMTSEELKQFTTK